MPLVNHSMAGASTKSPEGAETAAVGDGELDYTLTTVPDPLTVSPESSVALADLIIVGSRIHPDSIETNQIAVHVPFGSEAWQLVLDYTGVQTSINLTGWTATPEPANERILFKPNTGHATLTPEQGITVQLNKLRINRQVGTAPVVMALNWRTAGSGGNFRTEEQTLGLGKFPPGFYLRNLKADRDHIDNGDSVTLTWERSTNATYTLLYEDKSIDVTNYSTFTVNNITRNTMFYIEGAAQQGTGSATRRINTYVTVNKPDLEVGDLTVHGNAKLFTRTLVELPTDMERHHTIAESDGILKLSAIEGNLQATIREIPGEGTGPTYLASPGKLPYFIPVVKGSEVIFSWPDSQDSPGWAIPNWYSFGSGGLAPHAPSA